MAELPVRAFILDDDPTYKLYELNRAAAQAGAVVVGSEVHTDGARKLVIQDLLIPSIVDVIFLDARFPYQNDGRDFREYLGIMGVLHEDGVVSPDGIVVVGAAMGQAESEELGTLGLDGEPMVVDWNAADLGMSYLIPQVRELKPATYL